MPNYKWPRQFQEARQELLPPFLVATGQEPIICSKSRIFKDKSVDHGLDYRMTDEHVERDSRGRHST